MSDQPAPPPADDALTQHDADGNIVWKGYPPSDRAVPAGTEQIERAIARSHRPLLGDESAHVDDCPGCVLEVELARLLADRERLRERELNYLQALARHPETLADVLLGKERPPEEVFEAFRKLHGVALDELGMPL